VRPSVQSAATSNRRPIGGVGRPIGGVPISMMLRGCTKFPAVETTHIHDILRVRGIKKYFNEFLSNCLAFSRSKFVHLPHCRQHCHINRFAASGIQASESKLRILVTSNGGFLASTSTEFKTTQLSQHTIITSSKLTESRSEAGGAQLELAG